MNNFKRLISSAIGHVFLVVLIFGYYLLRYSLSRTVIIGLFSVSLLLFLFNSAKPYSWLTSLASLMAPAVYYCGYFTFAYIGNFTAVFAAILIFIFIFILVMVIMNKIHDFVVEIKNTEERYSVLKRKTIIIVFLQIILTAAGMFGINLFFK